MGREAVRKGGKGQILETAIVRVAGGKLLYRGEDAAGLAQSRSFEEVCSLLWTGRWDADVFDTPLHVIGGGAAQELPFINRAQSVLPLVAARDSLSAGLAPLEVARTGWRIVNLLTSVAGPTRELEQTVEETLARAWELRSRNAAALLRAALILSADGAIDSSAWVARCMAATGANPYGVVAAAMGTIDAQRMALAEESLSVRQTSSSRAQALTSLLDAGAFVRSSDPAASAVMELLPRSAVRTSALALVRAAGESPVRRHPALAFALAALTRSLGAPHGAAIALFSIGRTVGWIAHAIEQLAEGGTMTPGSRFTGARLSRARETKVSESR